MQAEADALAQGMTPAVTSAPCDASAAILLAVVVTTGVVATAPPTLAAPPKWVQRIDDVVGRDAVSVTIGYEGTVLYRHKDWVRRAPASNEKLLLSMALLDRVPPDTTIPTRVLATKAVRADGTLRGRSVDRGARRSRDRPAGPRGARRRPAGTGRGARARPRDGVHRPVRP